MIVSSSREIAPISAHDHENTTVAVVLTGRTSCPGNTAFVDTLCEALAQRGATPLPVFCASLRSADAQLAELLNPADAVITTVLAAWRLRSRGTAPARAIGTPACWPAWDVPVLQGLCLTSSRAQWD